MADIYQLISEAEKLRPAPAKMSIEDIEAEMRIIDTLANLSLGEIHTDCISAADIRLRAKDLRNIALKYIKSATSLKKRSRILLTIYKLITELPLPGNNAGQLTDYYRQVDTLYSEWLDSPKRDVATNAYIFCNLVNYFCDEDNTADGSTSGHIDPRLTLIHDEAASAIDELTTSADGHHWENMDISVALHRLTFLSAYCHGFRITTLPAEYLGALHHYTAELLRRFNSETTTHTTASAPTDASTLAKATTLATPAEASKLATPTEASAPAISSSVRSRIHSSSTLRMLIQLSDILYLTPSKSPTLPIPLQPHSPLSYPLLSHLIRTTLPHHLAIAS